MQTAEARDAMVARVQAAFAEHRTFYDWPVLEQPGNISQAVDGDPPFAEKAYVEALYAVCAIGTPTGRMGKMLIGERLPAGE